jgi:hypothetical protein
VIVCLRCGEKNPADEQFCGNCGTFLEWRGDARSGEVTGAGDPGDPVANVASLIRCPRCGTANAQGRTFCQSCGERLPKMAVAGAAGSPVQSSSPSRAAAPAVAPPRPATLKEPEPAGRSRLPILIGGGLVIGIAIAAFALLRGGEAFQSRATDVPTRAASAAASATPEPSATGSDSPADVTLAPGLYVDLDGGVLTREDGDDVDLLWGVAGTEGVLHARNGAQLGLLVPPEGGDAELCREVVDATPLVDIPVATAESHVLCVVTTGDQVGRLIIERAEGPDLTMNFGVFTD